MGSTGVQEWEVALVNVTELWEAVARAKCRPLILSPVLFQYHTASRPTCVPGPCISLSHNCGHSRTWGQTTLSQPGAFEPSPSKTCTLLSCCVLLPPEFIHPGDRAVCILN